MTEEAPFTLSEGNVARDCDEAAGCREKERATSRLPRSSNVLPNSWLQLDGRPQMVIKQDRQQTAGGGPRTRDGGKRAKSDEIDGLDRFSLVQSGANFHPQDLWRPSNSASSSRPCGYLADRQ